MDNNKIKIGSDAVVQRLVGAMSVGGQLHPQSAVSALGCLAGYACQADIRSKYIITAKMAVEDVFEVFSDRSGKHYYFGELTDKLLIGEGYSLWGMLSRVSSELPDINEILGYVSSAAGSDSFGNVRSVKVGDTMQSYLKMLWAPMSALAMQYCEPGELHIVFAAALTKMLMAFTKQNTDGKELVRISMESAVSMSRVDIREI